MADAEVFGEGWEDGDMCVELNLAWAVENGEGFFVTRTECLVEPVEVFKEEPVVGGRERSGYEVTEVGHRS